MAIDRPDTDSVVHNDIAVGCDWKCIGYIDPSPKQANAYDNKCFFVKFGCIGYIAGSVMYAIHIDRNIAKGLCVR